MIRARRNTQPSIVRILSPLRDFLATEAFGAVLLGIAAVAALVWANSPAAGSYESLWNAHLSVTLAGHTLDLDLRHWVNDGLMTVFFLVVGLEIKRELTDGHLSSRKASLLPVTAALGGMLVPALLYLAIAGSSAPRGWAIPIATDIALAVGVVALAGPRIPGSARAFLLGLAIVDDIGAIVVIAFVYSTGVAVGWLAAGMAALVVVAVLKRFGVTWTWVYVVVGCVAWFGFYEGGVHPTIAGVAMGLLAPSTPRLSSEMIDVEALTDLSGVLGRARDERPRQGIGVGGRVVAARAAPVDELRDRADLRARQHRHRDLCRRPSICGEIGDHVGRVRRPRHRQAARCRRHESSHDT
jgi:NhaA family Na+:H+ antiporter